MTRRVMRLAIRYDTAPDRAGLALGVGSAMVGTLLWLLVLAGGQRDPLALAAGWMGASLFAALGMTALGGPLWLVMHVAGLRRGRHAALVGGLSAMAILLAAQTDGFGMFATPSTGDAASLRWPVAIATSLMAAGFAAGVAAIMWRIAYRRSLSG
jgi:hypothetical protein